MLTVWVAEVPMGTLPKSRAEGLAVARLMPVPLTVKGMGMQLPPAMGHSKTLVVPVELLRAVGLKLSLMVHVPGPEKRPPAPQVSKSNENGELMPLPLAS